MVKVGRSLFSKVIKKLLIAAKYVANKKKKRSAADK